MITLAIDTSNFPLGIALMNDEIIMGETIANIKKNHSIGAMPAVERLLNECGVSPSQLNRVVVAKGPGSYTGVRIGVTIAKTMAFSLGIPLVGVSSLAVMAGSVSRYPGLVCPIFDARRGLVYTGLYKWSEDGQFQTVEKDQNVLLSEYLVTLAEYKDPILFVGNDVHLHADTIKSALGDKAIFNKVYEQNPRPSILAWLGTQEEEASLHEFVPNYARMVEAEVKWLEKQQNEVDLSELKHD
jgi:tRNA threonylcarbamoyladenosine biosynthesis protein TsaB